MINHKLLFVLLSSLLLSACVKKVDTNIVTDKLEYTISYKNGTKTGEVSKICVATVIESCPTEIDYLRVKKYVCDLNNKLYIEDVEQDGFTCTTSLKSIFVNEQSSNKREAQQIKTENDLISLKENE